MTAHALHGRELAGRRVTGLMANIRTAWRNYWTYWQTLSELRAKEVRDREDIGLAGADLEAFARHAAYGRT